MVKDMITKHQARVHNEEVIANVSAALLENRMVDSYRFLNHTDYAARMITSYIKAANIAREMMHMPKLFLYDLHEFED